MLRGICGIGGDGVWCGFVFGDFLCLVVVVVLFGGFSFWCGVVRFLIDFIFFFL